MLCVREVKLAKNKMSAAFLFHRSLRLEDNLGLLQALQESKSVLPIFCVDPRQASPRTNKFFSPFSLGFMLQSLTDLQDELKKNGSDLLLVEGEPHRVLPPLLLEAGINTLYMNHDYTPFARKRATEIEKALHDDISVVEVEDYLLFPPGSITTGSGSAYRVYTPFYNATKGEKISKPNPLEHANRLMKKGQFKSLLSESGWDILQRNSQVSLSGPRGGRTEGLRMLAEVQKTQRCYAECRDYLTYSTSQLSPYIKFGCISIRETWEGLGKLPSTASTALRRQLMWREFYYHYYIAYPAELEWEKKTVSEAKLSAGAPDIVKACFQELDITGCLHNRGRMILANYLLHNQNEYWKIGDVTFARRLIDYDPFVNVGNWRWIDKQPRFRWLKPDVQYLRWDKDYPKSQDRKGKGSYTSFWLQSKDKIQKDLS